MKTRKIALIAASAAVALSMIGAGVYASWSETATASQNLQVGTFGMRIVAATSGAVIAPDGKSVTYTVPEIRDSVASSAPFTFTVRSTGQIPMRVDANETGHPAAPFFGLPVVPDGDTVLHLDEQVVFNAGIGWPELGMGDLGRSTSVVYTISASEGPPRPVLVAPTAVQKSCNANDGGITIPSVTGVDYLIGGVLAPSGFNQRSLGSYVVTAAAQSGFDPVLVGYPAGGWNLTVTEVAGCVSFTLGGTTVLINNQGSYVNGPAPVVDNVAHTITWTIPVTTAAPPSGCFIYCQTPFFGRFTSSIPEAELDVISATATLSPSLAGQESKFNLFFRNSTFGVALTSLGTLPSNIANLRSTQWNAPVGGHHVPDNGLGANWAAVTGTGSVTIVLSFSATA